MCRKNLPVVAALLAINSERLRKMAHLHGDAPPAFGGLAMCMLPSWDGQWAGSGKSPAARCSLHLTAWAICGGPNPGHWQ
jgi:hypothetical protein